jgi:hypothetical protein
MAPKTTKSKASEPKAEPLTVASNDDILAEMVKHTDLLASINEILKLERKQRGYDLTVTEGSII